MNLNIYDNVNDILDKQSTWINICRKLLFSREIKYRKYTTLVKRYKNGENKYYIILSDNIIPNKESKITYTDNYGRIVVKLNSIWNNTLCKDLKIDTNIDLNLVEYDDTCEVYLIDI